MAITGILGEQRGDEGKGRLTDELAHSHDIVARFNGGPNAGHTILLPDGLEIDLHSVPSGITHEHTVNVIGNGTFIDPVKLVQEIEGLRSKGISVTPDNLKISYAAHVITARHVSLDVQRESGLMAQNTTKSGISGVAADKAARVGLRIEDVVDNPDLFDEMSNILLQDGLLDDREAQQKALAFAHSVQALGSFVTDTVELVNTALEQGKNVLAEGAQAFLLDLDHGMYPEVTSSPCTTSGILSGLGVAPHHIRRIIGVAKATPSHVGNGPFVTEETDPEKATLLRGQKGQVDAEYGTTTGRERRMGYLDLAVLRSAHRINGTHEIALTKLDCVPRIGRTTLICTGYTYRGEKIERAPGSAKQLTECEPIYEEFPTWDKNIQGIRWYRDLPIEAQRYLTFIEEQTNKPIRMIGVGPGRNQVIWR